MTNKRMVYQDMFEDDEIGTMAVQVRLLWVGLIVAVADDQGRLLDNTSLIKSKVFVYDSDITEDMITDWLCVLSESNMIIKYQVGNKQLIQIVKWWKYQTPAWASESKFQPPNNWIDRARVHGNSGKVKTINWDINGGFPTNPPTLLPTLPPTHLPKPPIVNTDINTDTDINTVKNYDESFQKVWEKESEGKPVKSPQAFFKMLDEFKAAGVTPTDYRTAIQEQSKSTYKVTSPTSAKQWALGIAELRKQPAKKNGKKADKSIEYGDTNGGGWKVLAQEQAAIRGEVDA